MPIFLIADDSQEKITFLCAMLERVSWKGDVLIAMTTEEAMATIDAHPEISAAFIDYYIPSENGPAVIRYLRQKSPQCRIALVSSADNAENSARAINAGAEATVCTTYSSDVVEKTILHLLESWTIDI